VKLRVMKVNEGECRRIMVYKGKLRCMKAKEGL